MVDDQCLSTDDQGYCGVVALPFEMPSIEGSALLMSVQGEAPQSDSRVSDPNIAAFTKMWCFNLYLPQTNIPRCSMYGMFT